MKKLTFAAALAATTAFAAPAFAATSTTTIGADITPVCTIAGPSDVTNLNLAPAAVGTIQTLGNVTIQCNNGSGFTASATSGNSGLLKSAHGTSGTTYSYVLNVAGLGDANLATAQSINSHTYGVDDYALGPVPVAVGVKITGHTGAAFAGDYRDTIVWTITANG